MKNFRDKNTLCVVEAKNKEEALSLLKEKLSQICVDDISEVKKQRCYRCGGAGEVADVYRKYEKLNIISCMMCHGNGHVWEEVL